MLCFDSSDESPISMSQDSDRAHFKDAKLSIDCLGVDMWSSIDASWGHL